MSAFWNSKGDVLMKVGRMRYRIEIQDYVSSTDIDGFAIQEWTTIHTVWADITPVSGKEYLSSNQETAEVTGKIYIRYLEGIKTTMRIQYGRRYFDIESILTDDRAGMITLMAKEVE
jgi:SPP1 family predicted phage head-tail adaptor